jgi:hypothetical protein
VYGSEESGFLGPLFAVYLEAPLLRRHARNSGCRVAMLTVMMAVPASVNVKTANTLFVLNISTSEPPSGRNASRTSERTLAPVARNIKKQTQIISPIGMRRSLASTGRHARTKTQSQAAFSDIPMYSRGLTIVFQSRQWPSVFGVRRFKTVGTPH